MSELLPTVAGARAFCEAARARGATVGLVPTMGALHDGHLSLLRRAVAENDVTVVSIFVNPLQFGAGEDLEAYPRDFDDDVRLCAAEGAAAVFAPGAAEMYPEPPLTSLDFGGLSASLEGACRPGHLAGVGVVVAKLFAIVGGCRAYFGEKDWQQLAVVRRLAADLSLPVEVVGCPTVREPDGLALSSRNQHLAPDDRERATVLFRALSAAVDSFRGGERSVAAIEGAMQTAYAAQGVSPEYAAVIDDRTFLPAEEGASGPRRAVTAARVGGTRLIDNLFLGEA